MSEDIRVGIITKHRGPHLSYYMRSFAICQGVKQVAIADSTGRHFEDAGEILKGPYPNLKTYRNYRRMLSAEKPQLVLVTMEAHLAPRRIQAALESGAHVVCEKPSCVRVEDFQKLADLATSKNLCLMLAMANRFAPPVQKAKELVQAGKLGKLFSADVYMVADQTRLTRPRTQNSWVSKKALSGGGHLIWLGIHWLDLVQYITGDRVHKVGGFTSNVGGQPVDIEDAAVLSLLYQSGMVGTMHSGYYLDRGYHSHVAIWGEKGWLRFDLTAQQPLEWQSTLEGMPQGIQTFSYSRGTNFYLGIIQAAVDCARGAGDSGKSADESLSVLKTIFGLYRAAETGRTQTLGS